MPTRFSHACIVSPDPESLVAFYMDVFGMVLSGPERNLSGPPLERGMGLPGARVRGFHLALPGLGEGAPTLEIFTLDGSTCSPASLELTRYGLMHLAFAVDDVHTTLDRILALGGSKNGEIAEVEVKGVGTALFIYARDPEGNVVELQGWK